MARPGRLHYPLILRDACTSTSSTTDLSAPKGSVWDGLLIRSDAWDFLAELRIERPEERGPWGRMPTEALERLRADFKIGAGALWLGELPRDFQMKEALEREEALYALLAQLILLGCCFFFGTWHSGLVYLVTIGLTGGMVLGLMGWCGHLRISCDLEDQDHGPLRALVGGRRLARVGLLVIPLGFAAIFRLKPAQDPSRIFGPEHPLRRAETQVRELRGWAVIESLVFETDGIPSLKKDLLERLSDFPSMARISGFSDLRDSVATQFHEPLTRELIAREFEASPAGCAFSARTGERRAHVFLVSSNTRELARLRNQVESLSAKEDGGRFCFLAGPLTAFSELSLVFIATLIQSLALSFALVLVLLLALNAHLQAVAAVPLALSLLWGPALVLVPIVAIGIEINSVTGIVMSLSIGLSGDNTVQFLMSDRGASGGRATCPGDLSDGAAPCSRPSSSS